jgi:excisionase family DNA binding protein
MDSLRAFSIRVFCARYGVSRTFAYEQIKAGRLIAYKIGRRTLIRAANAEAWVRALPRSLPKTTPITAADRESGIQESEE